MKLKCIGGACDGEWHYAPNEYKFGDQVKVPDKPKSFEPNIMYFPSSPEAAKAVTVDYIIYQIDCFHFSKDDVRWTNKQALEHQFDK